MSDKFNKLDAAENIFFARQLEYLKTKTYDIKYANLKARSLIPVSFEAGAGAEFITYEQYDQIGMAKIISNWANDLPRADVKGKQFISPVKSLGASYGWNLQEVRASAFAGKSLEQRRANAAKRAILQKENSIAFLGDTSSNLKGFINNSNISEYTVPADGTASSKLWSAKTADLILRDLNGLVNSVVTASKGVEQPDTLLLPVAKYTYIASTPRSSTSDTTILQYFMMNNPFIKQVDWLNELSAAGAGSTDRMIAYVKDPDHLTLEIPQDFEQLPVQENGLEFKVPCHSRCGGVLIYYPLSVVFGDGI
jgi:hypothetical protein